ncbi:hypothetical protein DICA3_C03928 [Diutina catenulata]
MGLEDILDEPVVQPRKRKAPVDDDFELELPAIFQYKGKQNRKITVTNNSIKQRFHEETVRIDAEYQNILNQRRALARELNDNGTRGNRVYSDNCEEVDALLSGKTPKTRHFYYLTEPDPFNGRRSASEPNLDPIKSIDDLIACDDLRKLQRFLVTSTGGSDGARSGKLFEILGGPGSVKKERGIHLSPSTQDPKKSKTYIYLTEKLEMNINKLGAGREPDYRLSYFHDTTPQVVLKLTWFLWMSMELEFAHRFASVVIPTLVGVICDQNAYTKAHRQVVQMTNGVINRIPQQLKDSASRAIVTHLLSAKETAQNPDLMARVVTTLAPLSSFLEAVINSEPKLDNLVENSLLGKSVLSSILGVHSKRSLSASTESLGFLSDYSSSESDSTRESTPDHHRASQFKLGHTADGVCDGSIARCGLRLCHLAPADSVSRLLAAIYLLTPLTLALMSPEGRAQANSRLINFRTQIDRLRADYGVALSKHPKYAELITQGYTYASFYSILLNVHIELIADDFFYDR